MSAPYKRIGISKKIRFEVFKRDNFTCQYCGAKAPDVALECDHINPVANGGENNILNLVTACFDCNRGKSKNDISDQSALAKQRKQVELNNDKLNQLELMSKWRECSVDIEKKQIDFCNSLFEELTNYSVSEQGSKQVKKWIASNGVDCVAKAIEESIKTYASSKDDDSINKAWEMIPRVAKVIKGGDSEVLKKVYYIRAILRNRGLYTPDDIVKRLLDFSCGDLSILDEIEHISKHSRNWTTFRESVGF